MGPPRKENKKTQRVPSFLLGELLFHVFPDPMPCFHLVGGGSPDCPGAVLRRHCFGPSHIAQTHFAFNVRSSGLVSQLPFHFAHVFSVCLDSCFDVPASQMLGGRMACGAVFALGRYRFNLRRPRWINLRRVGPKATDDGTSEQH